MTAAWILGGVALTLVLRLPWLHTALSRDEGGVAMIATRWEHFSPFPYGDYFLDRPPLLVALYKVAAGVGGAFGVRIMGAVAAALLVAISALLAERLGGPRAVPFAAVISALLASSFAIGSVFTPAELLASVASAGSILVLLWAIESDADARARFGLAGALAASAFLIKQSFADALLAGGVGLLVDRRDRVLPRAVWLRNAAAYAAGAGALGAALVVWAMLTQPPRGSVFYAIFGFRLDAGAKQAATGALGHVVRLRFPLIASGLLAWAAFAVGGVVLLRRRRAVAVVLATWGVAASGGVLAGGSYWPHYLIALVAATAACAAVALARRPRLGIAATTLITLATVALALRPLMGGAPKRVEREAVTVGDYLRDRAAPNQSAYVLYAKVNVLFYSRMRAPFPYNWALMMRAVPGAQQELRRLLGSELRPNWIVLWQRPRAFGLDRSGATRALLSANYRRIDAVCGRAVLLERDTAANPEPKERRSCRTGT